MHWCDPQLEHTLDEPVAEAVTAREEEEGAEEEEGVEPKPMLARPRMLIQLRMSLSSSAARIYLRSPTRSRLNTFKGERVRGVRG